MTSDRSYRPMMDKEYSAGEIRRNLGTLFDPVWGEIFLDLFRSGSIG